MREGAEPSKVGSYGTSSGNDGPQGGSGPPAHAIAADKRGPVLLDDVGRRAVDRLGSVLQQREQREAAWELRPMSRAGDDDLLRAGSVGAGRWWSSWRRAGNPVQASGPGLVDIRAAGDGCEADVTLGVKTA
jgi:hypothetical protein